VLRLILPKGNVFPADDYGRAHQFKIYNEDETVFDATGYTGYAMVSSSDGSLILEKQVTWTTQTSGIGTFAFTSSNRLATTTASGYTSYYLEIQLELAGTILSTERIQIYVMESAIGGRTP